MTGATLIDPTAAAEEATRGVQAIHLEDDPAASAARAAGHVGQPLLVRRLDAPDRDYYLVPWQDRQGIAFVVQIDAQSGAMSSLARLPTPLPRIVVTPEEARRAVADQLHRRVVGEPRLVWRPCRESASPLQPLYHVAVEEGNAFVGVDGAAYPRLTPFGKGG